MGLSTVTYVLARKYTDETAAQFGGLKGAPCKVKSVEKSGGQSVITLEWKNDEGVTQESEVYVNDGVTMWVSGRNYAIGDLVIYNNVLYYCSTANSDAVFTPNKWTSISGSSAESEYYIIDLKSALPNNLTSTDRRIYFCLEDGNFYLWNGVSWEVISSSVKVLELTQAQYNALTPAEKLNGTIYFVTDAPGGGGIAALTNDMTTTKAVGGVTIGTRYEAGTFLENILRDILAPTLYPTFTNPSASISATGAKLLEVGATLNTTITISLNRGSINPAYGTSGYRSGPANRFSLNGGTQQVSGSFSETVSENNKTFSGTAYYDAGEQPKDSAGQNYNSPLPAGSVNTSILTYEFVEAMYANVNNIAIISKLALVSKNTRQREFEFPAQTIANSEVFDIPADWVVTAIEVLNTLSNQWEDCSSEFDISNTTHEDAAGNEINYKRYTDNRGYSADSRKVRVKWN